MKRLALVTVFVCGSILSARADHPIPKDSKQPWDFRGKPSLTNADYEKLFKCKTYEELRDLLPKTIASLEKNADCAAPIYVASECRLALIRTHYLLGETEKADKLLAPYSAAHQPNKILAAKLDAAQELKKRKERWEQAEALDAKKDIGCLTIYAEFLTAPEFTLRWRALDRLRQLTDQDFGYYAAAQGEERTGPARRWVEWVEANGSKAKINWER